MISFDAITKSYGDETVLGPVSLEIPAGGMTALIGPNGAGKSTLLTIAGRLLEPTSGTASVDGHDVQRTPSRDLAKLLSILRQENHFVTRLTVRELVGFGRFPHSRGRLTPEDNAHVDAALEFLNLGELASRHLDELSGGQRQRAYVAMVLAQDTDYVLLDEPLNNLDMRHAVAMMQQLRRAVDELGKTIVIVLHDINFASAYADRIIALDRGQLVFNGTPDELMVPDILEGIFETPMRVHHDAQYPVAIYFRS